MIVVNIIRLLIDICGSFETFFRKTISMLEKTLLAKERWSMNNDAIYKIVQLVLFMADYLTWECLFVWPWLLPCFFGEKESIDPGPCCIPGTNALQILKVFKSKTFLVLSTILFKYHWKYLEKGTLHCQIDLMRRLALLWFHNNGISSFLLFQFFSFAVQGIQIE